MTKEELISEYAKCYKDTGYAIESYLETYDNTQSKYVPFKLFPEQQMMLNNFEKHQFTIDSKFAEQKNKEIEFYRNFTESGISDEDIIGSLHKFDQKYKQLNDQLSEIETMSEKNSIIKNKMNQNKIVYWVLISIIGLSILFIFYKLLSKSFSSTPDVISV